MMKSVPLLVLLFAVIVSCKQAPHKPVFGSERDQSSSKADGDADSSQAATTDIAAKGLALQSGSGSKLRFVDGRGLTEIYGRVFRKDASGYAHCASSKPNDYQACDLIFAPDERPAMGVFDLYSQRMNRGIQNVNKAESMTLNYMRSLRAALGRECERLVGNEEKALMSDANAATLFFKADGPTSASLSVYFLKLMGADGSAIDFQVPYDSYVKAYQSALSGDSDPAKAKHNAYVNLCLSISMEPQIFLY